MANKQVYVLTTALATSLGANVMLAGNVNLKAAIAQHKTTRVAGQVPEANKAAVAGFVNNVICPDVNAQIAGASCQASDFKRLCFRPTVDDQQQAQIQYEAAVDIAGEWTPGVSQ